MSRGRLVPVSSADRLPPDEPVELVRHASPPQLSVLMPLFRQEQFVVEAVESILAQEGVVADILISDDASGDGTLQLALDTIARHGDEHPHGVRVRRGSARLRRWHVIELMRLAAQRDIVQAHGDDVALPGRLRAIRDAFQEHDAAFVATGFRSIDAEGRPLVDEAGLVSGSGTRLVDVDEALGRPAWAIGAVEAWRRDAFTDFRTLKPSFAPLSHDRIVLLRAALLGRAVVLPEPFVHRRVHDANWHDSLVDSSSELRRKHGWAIGRLLVFGVFLDDIEAARAAGRIGEEAAAVAAGRVRSDRERAFADLRRAHGELLADGQRLVWTEDP